jgi:hypothetical protein
VSLSPARPDSSAPPSSASSSEPGTRSPAWPVRIRPPRRWRPPGARAHRGALEDPASLRSGHGHFGLFALFASVDAPVSSALTRARLGWAPFQSGLLPDLDDGQYFKV